MSTPMVQAYMAGLKNQTRRLNGLHEINAAPDDWELDLGPKTEENGKVYFLFNHKKAPKVTYKAYFPYGNVGSMLWFRESWNNYPTPDILGLKYLYKADKIVENIFPNFKWKPSIHMPREAARFTLKVLAYRLERLKNISDSDAINEGIEKNADKFASESAKYRDYIYDNCYFDNPISSYHTLWDLLNAKPKKGKNGKIKPAYPWSLNPWVWVVEFERFNLK